MRMKGTLMRTSMDDLTERIQIVYHAKAKDAMGNVIDGAEQTRCNVWAKVYPYGARIQEGGVERLNQVDYRVVVRYRTDILPDDEVLWRGKRLRMIKPAYDAESARTWTVLECQEVLADAAAAQSLP